MTQQPPQAGFTLPTLMALLSVASLAALLALQALWVNERLLNAQADQLRTHLHAQAILPIVLQDILGTANVANGSVSSPSNLRHNAGDSTQNHVFFPTLLADYDTLRQRLGPDMCRLGICAPATPTGVTMQASFWQAHTNSAMPVSAGDTPYGDNTAWYWVEIFPRDSTTLFVYRITVLTRGVMPSSHTVLQALWTQSTLVASTGQWHSIYRLHN